METLEKYTKDECIDCIRGLASSYPDRLISRSFFRQESPIPEKDWVLHFGTFIEFKRQAGLSPIRLENNLLNNIALQASVENIRSFNAEKFGWFETYQNNFIDRFQTFLVISDIHDITCDPFFRRMTIEAAKVYNPEKIIFNGDLFELPEFSKFSKRVEDFDLVSRQKWVHSYLNDLRNVVSSSEFNLVEGNHEFRLVKYLMENAPLIMEALHLNGIGVREFLGLDKFSVNYYSRADFGASTVADIQNQLKHNYYQFRDIVLFHHYSIGRNFGMPGACGHNHKFETWNMFNKTYGSYTWVQSGCGQRRYIDYHTMMGEPWNNGFLVYHIDLYNKKNTVWEYIDCTNEYCYIAGIRYSRNDEEKKFLI